MYCLSIDTLVDLYSLAIPKLLVKDTLLYLEEIKTFELDLAVDIIK